MKLKGHMTISRPSRGDDDEERIRISFKDNLSRVQFLQVEIDLAEFTLALTGLSEQPCVFSTGRLDVLGKERQSERVSFELTEDYLKKYNLSVYDRDAIRSHLRQDPEGRFHAAGWALDTYLGSQGSFAAGSPDGVRINTHQTRYVEVQRKEKP